ncbi:hypothetical protein [Actinocorallia libanotica]|uniref:Uncharacterized protein n=1 Tax=Actinocorallia libanotica TaxID=46162 RepID=A0ABN1Q0R5_9ACTN
MKISPAGRLTTFICNRKIDRGTNPDTWGNVVDTFSHTYPVRDGEHTATLTLKTNGLVFVIFHQSAPGKWRGQSEFFMSAREGIARQRFEEAKESLSAYGL